MPSLAPSETCVAVFGCDAIARALSYRHFSNFLSMIHQSAMCMLSPYSLICILNCFRLEMRCAIRIVMQKRGLHRIQRLLYHELYSNVSSNLPYSVSSMSLSDVAL